MTTISSLPIGAVPYSVPGATAVERMLLLSPQHSDTAVISASSETAGLPAANLLRMQPGRKWRSNGATEAALTLTLASPVAADALALVGHNLSATGLVRVLSASLDLDTGWQSAWPVTGKPSAPSWPAHIALLRWATLGEATDWEVQIADPSLTYLQAGRLVLCTAWQPSINFDIGGTPIAFDPADVQRKTPYGRLFTDRRTASPPRVFEITSYALSRREAFDGIYEIQRLRGMWGDIVCVLDPGAGADSHRFAMQGVFTSAGAYTVPPVFDERGNMFGAAIKLRELI